MKYFACITVILLIALLASCFSSKDSASSLRKARQIEEMILAGNFTIEVYSALPMRGNLIPLTSHYDFSVKNDSAFAYLPYYGVAQYVPYGGGEGGIKFSEPVLNYVKTPMKKSDGWDIRFKVSDNDYTYAVFVQIYDNGNCSLSINPDQKDMISFSGTMKVD